MGKKLIIKGANFYENRIETFVPQTIEWEIGSISTSGVIGQYSNAVHTNLLDIQGTIAKMYIEILDASAFASEGAFGVIALYDNNGDFIQRIDGITIDSTHLQEIVDNTIYPTAKKVRFVLGNYQNSQTDVDVALSKFTYETEGI